MDIPEPDLCDAKLARSRTPANGDVVGGPYGADVRWLMAVEGGGICGGDGGGMLRAGKDGGGWAMDASKGPRPSISFVFLSSDKSFVPLAYC